MAESTVTETAVDCTRSKYYQGLSTEAKKRYDAKLCTLGSLGDPYQYSAKSLPTLGISSRRTRVWKRTNILPVAG